MTTQTQSQVAAALGINVRALWSLSSNPQFPRPASGSDQSVLWNASDITTFQALWTAALGRGWDACIAAISACPVTWPLRRRNSSAAMTTTSSRPCTVTCCGPSLRTLRTDSLKRALASCRTQ